MKLPENITLTQAKELLKQIKDYADITKKLGHRGRSVFSQSLDGSSRYSVEYYPALGEDAAWERAQRVFEKSFSSKPEKSEVTFTPVEAVKGGMKVYKDDFMVDMSFHNVEKRIQK